MPATRRSGTATKAASASCSSASAAGSSNATQQKQRHRVPLVTHDYRLDPAPYPALKTEQGVFTTPPYSAEIKHLWRFKDEASAIESSAAIWEMFEGYRGSNDFIGMDTSRKFLQMGRTRSLRYALRPGGQKYTKGEHGKKEPMDRTGKVYDEEKLKGANVFEGFVDRCWADDVYNGAFERWRKGERCVVDTRASEASNITAMMRGDEKRDKWEEEEEEREERLGSETQDRPETGCGG